MREMVEADVFGGALLGGEDAQLAVGRVDGLVVRAVCVFEGIGRSLAQWAIRNGTVMFSTTPSSVFTKAFRRADRRSDHLSASPRCMIA
ncbi:hypothetical protein [Actinoplanes sp. URMC 104]|uniref:hypothetical protein n=1 Tax=Actinoplanes sp. URMC 104 TaxID=3423409 RepID=UPI003F1A0596